MSDEPTKSQRPYAGEPRAAPYALSRLSGKVSLVEVAHEIEQADQWIASTTGAQLTLIAEQIAALRDKAQAVLERARENTELHRAEARFSRRPGNVYHLYERSPGGARYWSMLSPEEWGGTPPHTFVGSYRLEQDQSWTPVAEIDATSAQQREELERWLASKRLP